MPEDRSCRLHQYTTEIRITRVIVTAETAGKGFSFEFCTRLAVILPIMQSYVIQYFGFESSVFPTGILNQIQIYCLMSTTTSFTGLFLFLSILLYPPKTTNIAGLQMSDISTYISTAVKYICFDIRTKAFIDSSVWTQQIPELGEILLTSLPADYHMWCLAVGRTAYIGSSRWCDTRAMYKRRHRLARGPETISGIQT